MLPYYMRKEAEQEEVQNSLENKTWIVRYCLHVSHGQHNVLGLRSEVGNS